MKTWYGKKALSVLLAAAMTVTTGFSNLSVASASTEDTALTSEEAGIAAQSEETKSVAEETESVDESAPADTGETTGGGIEAEPTEATVPETTGGDATDSVAAAPESVVPEKSETADETAGTDVPNLTVQSNTEEANTESVFQYEFTDMSIEVSLETPESLPEGAALQVMPIYDQTGMETKNEEIQQVFDQFKALFEKQTVEQNTNMFEYSAYDICFVKDGQICKTTGTMHVKIQYKDGLVLSNMLADASNVTVRYLDDKSDDTQLTLGTIADEKKSVTLNEDASRIKEISFETTDFEQFAIGTDDNRETVYTYEDDTVVGTVTSEKIDPMLFGAVLQVTPVESGESYTEAAAMLDENAEAEDRVVDGFLLYDICFVKDGVEVEPSRPVTVSLNFKEAVKPEGVDADDIMLGHIRENGNEKTLETIPDATVNTNDAAVTDLEFTVDSFSKFTIQWGNTDRTLTVQLEDTAGNSIGDGEGRYKIEYPTSWSELKTIAPQITGYQYQGAHLGSHTGTQIYYIKRNSTGNNKTRYSTSSSKPDNSSEGDSLGNNTIVLVYAGTGGQYSYVTTLDTSSLISMNLFDYKVDDKESDDIGATTGWSSGINNGHSLKFSTGGNGQGINYNGYVGYGEGVWQGIVSPLLNNGYPKLSGNESLGYLFNTTNITNAKTSYTGANYLFRQDSDGYYYYDSAQNYAAYNASEGRFNVYASSEGHAGFFPFDTDPKKATASTGGRNHYFGLTMSANFSMPADNRVNGKEMVFEFSGDDDVWVFIDGVLVLDLGGIHQARAGSINFTTGAVHLDKTPKHSETNYTQNTTLAKVFKAAYPDTYAQYITSDGHLRTDVAHSINFYYLERGNDASNCKLDFNLPVIKQGSVAVSKNVSSSNQAVTTDKDFTFEAYRESAYDSGKYLLVTNTDYTVKDSAGTIVGTGNTGTAGTITIKAGQTAYFTNFGYVGQKYYFKETGVDTSQYTTQVDGKNTAQSDKKTILDTGEGETAVPVTTFTNTAAENSLIIKKEMGTLAGSNRLYKIRVTIGGVLYSGRYTTNMGSGTPSFQLGTATIQADEIITIPGVPAGTSFTVEEYDLPSGYLTPVLAVTSAAGSASDVSTAVTNTISGVDRKNAEVTITNTAPNYKLTIAKTITDLKSVNGDAIFTFQITDSTGKSLYRSVRFSDGTYDTDTKTLSFSISDLPYGSYTITELQTMRYELTAINGWTIAAGTTSKVITLGADARVTFTNTRNYEQNYSHTDMTVNEFTVTADGITVNSGSEGNDLTTDGVQEDYTAVAN